MAEWLRSSGQPKTTGSSCVPSGWPRLEADPSAFGSTLERELPFPEDRWREWTRTAACFLSVQDDAPTGMASLRVLPEPMDQSATAEINAMWVDPERRGDGHRTGVAPWPA